MKKWLGFSIFLILNMQFVMANMDDFLLFIRDKACVSEELYRSFYHQFLEGLKSQNSPELFVFAGAPGSGKTTWRKAYYDHLKEVHIHDMDAVLLRLPSYQQDLHAIGKQEAFERWWPVARIVADQLVQYAIEKKYSILYDRTCGAEGTYFDLLYAKKEGYRIQLYGFCIDAKIGLKRIQLRTEQLARTVTAEIFYEYRARFSALWPYYLQFVDAAYLYDNSETVPRLIFSNKEGTIDQIRYRQFLENGLCFKQYFNERIH